MADVQLKIKQVRSLIKRPQDQKDTMMVLGLGKMNREVVKQASPALIGMIRKVSHLVKVEEVK